MYPSQDSIRAPSHSGKSTGHAVLHFALPDDARSINPERYETIQKRVPTGRPGSIASSVCDSDPEQSKGNDESRDDTIVPKMSEDLTRPYQDYDRDGDSTVRGVTLQPSVDSFTPSLPQFAP